MALEGVLQYKAECNESVTVDPRMMHLLIGKAGEQINLIRSKSGAAIDADREKHLLKIRGTVAAVAEAKRAIVDTLAANKHCAESVVLPWHAIDVLIGPNASKLIALEAEHHVQIELPGQVPNPKSPKLDSPFPADHTRYCSAPTSCVTDWLCGSVLGERCGRLRLVPRHLQLDDSPWKKKVCGCGGRGDTKDRARVRRGNY